MLRCRWFLLLMAFSLVACETAYYNAWEKVGVHKRDILVDRIEDTQEAQEDTQEQFRDALEQYRAVVNFEGGDLADLYEKLNGEFEASEAAAKKITDRVDAVEDVAKDLFTEWEKELDLYTNTSLRRSSEKQLASTRREYKNLINAMRKAEKSTVPVLNTLRDQVLFLKHNLNARAIASLKGELSTIDSEVSALVAQMQKSIEESNAFIGRLKQ
ncbi:MAG: DUF2959 domain-containing protein [Pseudomonadales bacterium]